MLSLEFAGQPNPEGSCPLDRVGRFPSDFILLKQRHFHRSPLVIGGVNVVKHLTSIEKYHETRKRSLDKLCETHKNLNEHRVTANKP